MSTLLFDYNIRIPAHHLLQLHFARTEKTTTKLSKKPDQYFALESCQSTLALYYQIVLYQ